MRTVRSIIASLFIVLLTSSAWAAACDGFTDVDSASSFCPAVIYIKDHGITVGCTDTTYCPNDYVTRLQMAAFLQRAGQADPTNTLGDHTTAIGGGTDNKATGGSAFVGAGDLNWATGQRSSVLGGYANAASGYGATVGGGAANGAEANGSTVAGGSANVASGTTSTISGGNLNHASGDTSTVPGGQGNVASGVLSFAAGHYALADKDECALFSLWSTTTTSFGCNNWANVFRIGADNGMSVDYGAQTGNGNSNSYVYIGPIFAGKAITTGTGAFLSTGGTWTNSSDRAEKTDLGPVDSREVLERVVAMPVATWRYMSETDQRHLGPMAQDFYAAFGLGIDDKHIATIDEGGVALAAIQGLNAKLEDRDVVISALSHELAEIKALLAAMTVAH